MRKGKGEEKVLNNFGMDNLLTKWGVVEILKRWDANEILFTKWENVGRKNVD